LNHRPLRGARALITGAAGGLGLALARRLHERGCGLILVDRDADRLRRVEHSLGRPVVARALDLTDAAAVAALVDEIGDLDLLVNNAGVAVGGAFFDMALTDIETMLAVNLGAVLRLTRLALPGLVRRRGCLAYVASAAGLAAPGGLAAYAATKAGGIALCDALRIELADQGVDVFTACPAFVRTDIVRNAPPASGPEEEARRHRLDGLVKRLGSDPDRVARRIVRAIERREREWIPASWPRALVWLKRRHPQAADAVLAAAYTRLRHQGALP
jgi:short-subunit dehydrogenase